MSKSNKTWLITGYSSGLGRAFAKEVLETGYNAVVTSRNPKQACAKKGSKSCPNRIK